MGTHPQRINQVAADDRAAAAARGLSTIDLAVANFPSGLAKIAPYPSGGFSGHQAINLAVHLGAKTIVLLGYDCQPGRTGVHFFGSHPAELKNPPPKRLTEWAKRLEQVAIDAKKLGIRIVNCSRETAVTCFERMSISEFRTTPTS